MLDMKLENHLIQLNDQRKKYYQDLFADYIKTWNITMNESMDFTDLFLDILEVRQFIDGVKSDKTKQFNELTVQVANMYAVVIRVLQCAANHKLYELAKIVTIDAHPIVIELSSGRGSLRVMQDHANIFDVEDGIGAMEQWLRDLLIGSRVSFSQERTDGNDDIVNYFRFQWRDSRWNDSRVVQDFTNTVISYMQSEAACGWDFRKRDLTTHPMKLDDLWEIMYLFSDANAIIARIASKHGLPRYCFAGNMYTADSVRYAKC